MVEIQSNEAVRARAARLAGDAAAVLAWSLGVALASQVAIPLPFTPVPITLQTLIVLAGGVLLGPRRGAVAMLLYLAEGIAGLPVFSLGRAGMAHLLGPTGGYLIGFPIAALVSGMLAKRGLARTLAGSLATLVAGTAVIYACGLARLAVGAGWNGAISLGLVPFLPGEALKLAAGVSLVAASGGIRYHAPWKQSLP